MTVVDSRLQKKICEIATGHENHVKALHFFMFFFCSYLKSAAVPMWAVYQFLVSVVLLRILIVMMTITYRRIYDDLDKQWK